MKAVIIAGGLGTRLRPLTYNIPKPIVPVVNRPFVEYQIEMLKSHGIDEIILNLHYLSDEIKKILGDGRRMGVKLHYSIESTPLGTAGAVKKAEEYFKDAKLLVVFNGDILTDINISEVVEFHKKNQARATLTLTEVEDPTTYGLVLTDKDKRVTQFIEKPSWERVEGLDKKEINAGIYVLDTTIFKDVPKNTPVMFERAVFPDLLKNNERVFGYSSNAYWIDIGNPHKYKLAHEAVLRGDVTSFRIYGSREKGSIYIDTDVEIDQTAKIIGPAVIGKRTRIEANTLIKSFTVLGERVTVGHDSKLEDCIIWSGTRIGNNVKLNGCILGYNCRIEDGVSIQKGGIIADNTVISKGSIINA